MIYVLGVLNWGPTTLEIVKERLCSKLRNVSSLFHSCDTYLKGWGVISRFNFQSLTQRVKAQEFVNLTNACPTPRSYLRHVACSGLGVMTLRHLATNMKVC